jgi:hypothetical protein
MPDRDHSHCYRCERHRLRIPKPSPMVEIRTKRLQKARWVSQLPRPILREYTSNLTDCIFKDPGSNRLDFSPRAPATFRLEYPLACTDGEVAATHGVHCVFSGERWQYTDTQFCGLHHHRTWAQEFLAPCERCREGNTRRTGVHLRQGNNFDSGEY